MGRLRPVRERDAYAGASGSRLGGRRRSLRSLLVEHGKEHGYTEHVIAMIWQAILTFTLSPADLRELEKGSKVVSLERNKAGRPRLETDGFVG